MRILRDEISVFLNADGYGKTHKQIFTLGGYWHLRLKIIPNNNYDLTIYINNTTKFTGNYNHFTELAFGSNLLKPTTTKIEITSNFIRNRDINITLERWRF